MNSPDIQSAPGQSRPAAATRTASEPEKTGLLHTIQTLLYIIVIAIFIVTFTVQPFRIPSASMEPTLLVGDFLLVTKESPSTDASSFVFAPDRIHRGDIIIFHFPLDPSMHLIKRVVGVPGDHLKLRGGHVYIDDKPIDESYAVYRPTSPDTFRDNFPRLESAEPTIDSRWWIRMRNLIDDEGELIIPAGNYFVLGDNRNDSEDSRYWGFVPRADIVGKPLFIYFSLREVSDDPLAGPAYAAAPPNQHRGTFDMIASFARWGRTFRIVR